MNDLSIFSKESLTFTATSNDKHPVLVYLAGLQSDDSRHVVANRLKYVLNLINKKNKTSYDVMNFPWTSLRFEHLEALRGMLAKRYQPATANAMLTAVRGVVKAAWRLGLISINDYLQTILISRVRGQRVPRGRMLNADELAALLNVCSEDQSGSGRRDAALIALLYNTGIRRNELINLNLADFERDDSSILIPGKDNKQRQAFLVPNTKQALEDWLEVRGMEDGPLFCPLAPTGNVSKNRRLHPSAIYQALKRRAQQAGVSHFSPHDLRRTFISHMLDAGIDLVTIQKLAGHASPNTTSIYDRRPDDSRRQAVNKLHVPYTGKKKG